MTIKVGDRLPDGTLTESTEFDSTMGCPINPREVGVAEAVKGRRVVIIGVPGAYTPTCSAKHLPSYVRNFDRLKAKKVQAFATDTSGNMSRTNTVRFRR